MFRRLLKKQPRKPLSRQVNGLFEELESRILYSAAPFDLPPEVLSASETIHVAPVMAEESDSASGASRGNEATAGSGIVSAEIGYEQIRATIDGIELWPMDEDSGTTADPAEVPFGQVRPGVESENESLAPASTDSALLEFDETNRFWVQDDDSILKAGLNTRESFSALLSDSMKVADEGIDLTGIEEPPIVNIEPESESISIYHEQGPREVFESINLDPGEIQIADDLGAIPLVRLATLDI